jgi:hypothetical protein
MEPGRPFRLAKLTACRKVRGMYRRCRPKSSTSQADMGIKARWRKDFRRLAAIKSERRRLVAFCVSASQQP